jgi:hypothetical protein
MNDNNVTIVHLFLNFSHCTSDNSFASDNRKCIAQGSKSQGDVAGGGMQCTCIALEFCCRKNSNSLSKLFAATDSTLSQEHAGIIDNILKTGTALYFEHINNKFEGKRKYLLIDQQCLKSD